MEDNYNLQKSVFSSTGDVDANYRVTSLTERDDLISLGYIKIGHVIYFDSDDEPSFPRGRYELIEYPTFANLTGVVWDTVKGKDPGFTVADNGGVFITNRNENYYEPIGPEAIDLSITNSGAFPNWGATGFGSTAIGWQARATGAISVAIKGTTNSTNSIAIGGITDGVGSTSIGISSRSLGERSVAIGNSTSYSAEELAVGIKPTSYIPQVTSYPSPRNSDRVFIVGVGNDGSSPTNKDGLTILKNGKIGIGIDNFETTSDDEILQVNGDIRTEGLILDNLLTNDPITSGQVWNENGFLKLGSATNAGTPGVFDPIKSKVSISGLDFTSNPVVMYVDLELKDETNSPLFVPASILNFQGYNDEPSQLTVDFQTVSEAFGVKRVAITYNGNDILSAIRPIIDGVEYSELEFSAGGFTTNNFLNLSNSSFSILSENRVGESVPPFSLSAGSIEYLGVNYFAYLLVEVVCKNSNNENIRVTDFRFNAKNLDVTDNTADPVIADLIQISKGVFRFKVYIKNAQYHEIYGEVENITLPTISYFNT